LANGALARRDVELMAAWTARGKTGGTSSTTRPSQRRAD
jgi:hypothetical protein